MRPDLRSRAATTRRSRTREAQYCTTISFVSGDSINGPLHTNDAFAICGQPTFGRTSADTIEVSATSPGWFSIMQARAAAPTFTGTYVTSAAGPDPAAEQRAARQRSPNRAYKFNGQIHICAQRQRA